MKEKKPNFFQILGVGIDSTKKEIKLAYVKKVREFPPEKEPEKYNEIRKAFETLMDEDRRISYTAYVKYGDEIDELDRVGEEALDNGDYERAIGQFKKVLLIEARLPVIKNKLALAFIYNKQFDDGISILEELVEKYPKSAAYIGNLSYGFKEKGELDKAEELCLEALSLSPFNEGNLSLLMSIYVGKKELEKATEYLKNGIEVNKTEEFREFSYYYEFLRISSFKEHSEGVKEGIQLLRGALPDNKEVKDFVLWKVSKLADELYERCDFTDSSIILEELLLLDSDDMYNKKLYEETKMLSALVKNLNVFLSDDRLSKFVKNPIYYYFTRFRMSHHEYEQAMQDTKVEIEKYKDSNSKKFKNELNILKGEYGNLYALKKWYYKRLESLLAG
ncbi:MAG: DnaJ domain-containing protein [Bacillota bacterium]|nr:DnaJ domain-containing protein [Bacillota bacterium]